MTAEEANELRIFALNMGHFMPLLERKKMISMATLLQKYNAGEDVMRELAKVSALSELEGEIKGKLRTLEQYGKENT
jgi:hypothetical protein